MGEHAAGATRRLVRYLRYDEGLSDAVAMVWRHIGPQAIPVLVERLKKIKLQPYVKKTIFETIGAMGAPAIDALPI